MKRLIFLVTASLLAQDVVFKSNVQLHVVNLSVKDKDGKPVLNLKKEDIEVYEDNVKQNVAVFELQQLNNQPLAPAAAAPNGPDQVEVKVQTKVGTSVNTQAAIDDPT